jgi:hypothetical protein
VAIKVLKADGPAGGNPLCQIIGTKTAIENWLAEYYDTGNISENAYIKSQIEKI